MTFFNLFLLIIIVCVSVVCSFWDFIKLRVPNFVIFLGIVSVIFSNLIFCEDGIRFSFSRLMAVVLSGFFVGLFYFTVRYICNGRFGKGDILFGVFQGVCLVPREMILCLLIEVVCAAVFLFIKKIFYRNGVSSFSGKIPFVPFMSIGLLGTFFYFNFIR